MSVVGSLEDLSFPDVLQIIHASRRSSTPILTMRDGEHRVRGAAVPLLRGPIAQPRLSEIPGRDGSDANV